MKAVLNAVLSCDLEDSTDGSRHMTLDNRYQSPELCYSILRERFGILSTGTCRANRIGWDKDIMNLKKKTKEKGDHLVAYDDLHRVLAVPQWNDSKVVNLISSVVDTTMGEATRQRGAEKISYPCPKTLDVVDVQIQM